jgi:hypothetical protein
MSDISNSTALYLETENTHLTWGNIYNSSTVDVTTAVPAGQLWKYNYMYVHYYQSSTNTAQPDASILNVYCALGGTTNRLIFSCIIHPGETVVPISKAMPIVLNATDKISVQIDFVNHPAAVGSNSTFSHEADVFVGREEYTL